MNVKKSLPTLATVHRHISAINHQFIALHQRTRVGGVVGSTLLQHPGVALLSGVLAALLAAWILAAPWQAHIQVGGRFDSPFLRGFYATEYSREHQTDFRWSHPDATLLLPGVSQLAPLELRVHGDAANMPLRVDAGTGAVTLALRPGWQHIALLPRPDAWSGDVQVLLSTSAHTSVVDPRMRGIALDTIAIRGRGGVPPPGQACMIGLSVALTTLLTGWITRRTWPGLLVGVALTLGCIVVLALDAGNWRLMLTSYTGRLVLVLASGGILAVGVERLLTLLVARKIITLGPSTQRGLSTVAMLAFLLRFGAMTYPLNHNSDLPFILRRTWMVREGQLLTLFLPNLSLTPVQWEMDITIPRSPFYYILTVPVTFLPGYYSDRIGMMALSSVIDALAVVLIALLVHYLGSSGRAAIMAAFIASTLPLGLLLIVSWGIFPTLLSQCLSLLSVVTWLHLRPRLHQRRAQLILAASIALAWLSYPTALAFFGTTLFLVLVLLVLQRDAATLPTLKACLLALLTVTLLYYGWHLPAMLGKTLPIVFGETADNNAGGTGFTLKRSLDALWVPLLAKYGWLVLGMAGGGALLLTIRGTPPGGATSAGMPLPATQGGATPAGAPYDKTPHTTRRYACLFILAWCAAYIPFALADEYVVTLILKQVLHPLPMLALLGGVLLGQISQRRAGLVVAWAILLFIGWQGLLMDLDVIVNAFPQLK